MIIIEMPRSSMLDDPEIYRMLVSAMTPEYQRAITAWLECMRNGERSDDSLAEYENITKYKRKVLKNFRRMYGNQIKQPGVLLEGYVFRRWLNINPNAEPI